MSFCTCRHFALSFLAHICVVWLRLVYLCEYPNDGFGELVHFHIPPFQKVYSILWLETTYVEKYAVFAKFPVNKLKGVLKFPLGQTIDGSLLENTIEPKIWPFLQHINPFPDNTPFQISLLAFPLINKRPGEITTYQLLIPPLIKILNHSRFPTPYLQYPHALVNKLNHQILNLPRLNIPVINFLLLYLIPGIPIRLLVIIWQILRKIVLLQKWLILWQFSQLGGFWWWLHGI